MHTLHGSGMQPAAAPGTSLMQPYASMPAAMPGGHAAMGDHARASGAHGRQAGAGMGALPLHPPVHGQSVQDQGRVADAGAQAGTNPLAFRRVRRSGIK